MADLVGHVEQRHQAGEFFALDHLGIDAKVLVHLCPPARGAHRRIGMRKGEVPALRIEDVVVEFLAEAAIEPHRFFVEGDAFRRQVIRADDGRVAPGVAAAEVALVEHGDVAHAVSGREVVGGRKPVAAAADDGHVVARPELRPCCEEALHRPAPGEAVFQEAERHGSLSSLETLAVDRPICVARQEVIAAIGPTAWPRSGRPARAGPALCRR